MPNTNRATRFGVMTREIFSWDAAIRWIALDNPGHPPLLQWRDPEADTAATLEEPVAVDPLLFMLAGSRDDLYKPVDSTTTHHLRFVVLGYSDGAQIATRFGQYGQINIGISLSGNPYHVGLRLTRLLDSMQRSPVDTSANLTKLRESSELCAAS